MKNKILHFLVLNFIIGLPIIGSLFYIIGDNIDMYISLGLFIVAGLLYLLYGQDYFDSNWAYTLYILSIILIIGMPFMALFAYFKRDFILLPISLGVLVLSGIFLRLYQSDYFEKYIV